MASRIGFKAQSRKNCPARRGSQSCCCHRPPTVSSTRAPASSTCRACLSRWITRHRRPDALGTIHEFISALSEQGAAIELMHVGVTAPPIRRISDGARMQATKRTGDVVGTILNAAEELQADLIAMPTAGHHGFLDAIRGSTTERVLRHAPCPVLAVPSG